MRKPRKTDNNSFLAINRVREGTILVADDGFTCIPDHAVRKVFRDRGKVEYFDTRRDKKVNAPRNSRERLYVRCAHGGHHYLTGQICEAGDHGVPFDHYIGFWLKGTEPPKEKRA